MNETPQIPLPFPEIDEENSRQIRKFLKRVGINSQRIIEEEMEKNNITLENGKISMVLNIGSEQITFYMAEEKPVKEWPSWSL
jgi:hypothetical protein